MKKSTFVKICEVVCCLIASAILAAFFYAMLIVATN